MNPARRSKRPSGGWLRGLMTALGVAAATAICLHRGFERPPLPAAWLVGVQLAAAAVFGLRLGWASWGRPGRELLRAHWSDALLGGGGVLALLGVLLLSPAARGQVAPTALVVFQAFLVLRLLIAGARRGLEVSQRRLHPARMLVLSFVTVILIGGGLLALPKARSPELRAEYGHYVAPRILDCFFTATSATCVTGLTVYDTGRDFTLFGQVVILGLIQVGGLGIMILGGLFGLLVGRQLSLRQSLALEEVLSQQTLGQIRAMVVFIVVSTLACELVGAALLYPMFAAQIDSMGERLFQCVFHAVSAFCNAGFGLHQDNLVPYGTCWGVYVSIMPLIILGGLGFPVLYDLWGWVRSLRAPCGTLLSAGDTALPAPRGVRRRYRLRLHSKLALITSLVLIVGGAVLLFALESFDWRSPAQRNESQAIGNAMLDMPPLERAGAALFQSVTARTAGFNTAALDTSSMSTASHFLLVLLMFVGGSPVSTAGGIKTVTAAVLFLGVLGTLRGRDRVEIFGRTVPELIVRRAAVMVMVMFAIVALGTLLLCFTEPRGLSEVLFEMVSACGTVGLSTGLTPHLTVPGRIIIMLGMLAGRVGPLTLLVALAGVFAPARYEYPEEQVVIG